MLGSSTHVETSARGSMPMTYGCFITLRRLRRFSCGTHGRLGRLLVSSNSVHVINLASTTYLLGPSKVFWPAFCDWLHTTIGSIVSRTALLDVGRFNEQERYSVDFGL